LDTSDEEKDMQKRVLGWTIEELDAKSGIKET
jgi:hypothetical protein